MASSQSITQWIVQLQAGDEAAARYLWERYRQQMLRFARKRLQGSPRRAADEEDVALSAFFSFCRGAARGQFAQLLDRDDLEQLLLVLTTRKALRQIRHDRRLKRGGAMPAEGARAGTPADAEWELEQIPAPELTPAFAAQVAEEYQVLLDRLGDPELRAIAQGKLDGETNEEIAARLGRSLRTIERRLELIRRTWEEELTS